MPFTTNPAEVYPNGQAILVVGVTPERLSNPDNNGEQPKSEIPATADNAGLITVCLLILTSLAGLVLTISFVRRSSSNPS